MQFEPLVYAVGAGVALLGIGMAYREINRRRLWKMLGEGLEGTYPDSELFLDRESLGQLQIVNGPKCGGARTVAKEDGFWLKHIGIFANGYTFRIPWSAIKHIDFSGIVYSAKYGNDYMGLATITLNGERDVKLRAPWRGIFDASVPSDVQLKSTQVVRNDS